MPKESGQGALRQRIRELEQRVKVLEQEVREHSRIENGLRENQRKMRIMIDHMFQFVGMLSADGTLIDVNQAALDSIGAVRSEVLGKPFWETPWWAHSPELQQKIKNAMKAASKGKFVRLETTHVATNGTMVYGDFSLNPVKDERGHVVYLIPELRNITERKKIEEALRQSENTTRALLDAPTESALLMDPNFIILAINEEAARRFGMPVHELIGKNVFDLLPPDVTIYRKQKVLESIKNKKQVRFEDSHKGRYYDHNIFPVLNEKGSLIQLAVYSKDITDFKRAQIHIQERTAELIESEEKYRTLVENVPLVVYRLKSENNIFFVNEFVQEICGYSPSDFFKNPDLWIGKIYHEDRERVTELLKKSFLEGKEFVAEYRIRHKNGYLVYVVDHAIPFRATDDSTTSVDGILMDVSQRMKLQAQLVHAEGLKTIAEVSARLAHEIRNPLVSAGGFARRLLRSMPPSDPNRNKVEIIVQEVSRLESILRMILNYIHPIELDLSPVDPNTWVEKAINEVVAKAEEKDIKITRQLSRELPQLSIDYEQMTESLITIFRNALYQMEKGSRLSVLTRREGEVFKLQICYPVKNIPRDDIKAFFYPFTTSPMILDTVDLSTAKALINKHGGTINADLKDSDEIIIEISLPF